MELTESDRQTIRAIARDRAGIDRRLLELDTQIQNLLDEREVLRSQRLSNAELARKFEVCTTTIHYVINGRLENK